jgi:serine protease Do
MTGFKLLISFLVLFFIQSFVPLSLHGKLSPVVEVVRKATPAIVNIRTEEYVKEESNKGTNLFKKIFHEAEEDEGEDLYENIGSGVVIDPRGIVLTNEHLISKAINIKVKFVNGKEFDAHVLGCDPEFDLAVLKIKNGKDFPYLKLKRRDDLMVGESVIVIGNPYGLSSSVSTGVISALGRNLRVQKKVFANLIQTDAAINPGNSGGALLDLEGNLIGIVTAVLGEGKGIGFAIPASDIEGMISDLIEYGKEKPIVGVFVERQREDSRLYLIVKKVIEKSPAEKCGLKEGDRIVEINRRRLREGTKLKEIVGTLSGRDYLQLRVLSNGKERFVNLAVTEIYGFRPDALDQKFLEIRVSNLSAYTRLKYRIREKKGAIVTKVKKGGLGYLSGIRQGDLILKINNMPVEGRKDFERLMLEGIKKNYLLYQVQRGKSTFFLPLKFDNLL